MFQWLGDQFLYQSAHTQHAELKTQPGLFLSTPRELRASTAPLADPSAVGALDNPLSGVPYQRALLYISAAGVQLYRYAPRPLDLLHIPPDALRWFGRPVKYNRYGRNDLWIHAEIEGVWQVIGLRTWYETMRGVVRALKAIASEEQVMAYRRHRPYVHYGPVVAQAAVQEVTGEWTLSPPVELYVMPLFLVLLGMDGRVRRLFPLRDLTAIQAVRRLDAPGGLARFVHAGEPMAFAAQDYERLAAALADAARLSLDTPADPKRKGEDWEEE